MRRKEKICSTEFITLFNEEERMETVELITGCLKSSHLRMNKQTVALLCVVVVVVLSHKNFSPSPGGESQRSFFFFFFKPSVTSPALRMEASSLAVSLLVYYIYVCVCCRWFIIRPFHFNRCTALPASLVLRLDVGGVDGVKC